MAEKPIPDKCAENAEDQLPGDADDEPTTEAANAPTPNITNTCYDCLEHVFDYLDCKSLLNLAGTCRHLQIAAAARFGQNFGKKRIVVSPGYANQDKAVLNVYGSYIQISGIKFCLPFLRCFGAKFTELAILYSSIYWDTKPKHVHYIDQYVNQYCADTLTSITLRGDGDRRSLAGNLVNRFKNVKMLDIHKLCLNNGLSSVGDLFPNLRSLSINSVEYGNHTDSNAALHLPHLEHLNISLNRPDNRIVQLLQANDQLQSLELLVERYEPAFGVNKLLNMIKGMALLSKLVMKMHYLELFDIDTNEVMRLASEHPLLVELHFGRYLLTANDAIKLIGQLTALKKFRFQVKDRSHYERLMGQLGSNSGWAKIEYQPDIITLSR